MSNPGLSSPKVAFGNSTLQLTPGLKPPRPPSGPTARQQTDGPPRYAFLGRRSAVNMQTRKSLNSPSVYLSSGAVSPRLQPPWRTTMHISLYPILHHRTFTNDSVILESDWTAEEHNPYHGLPTRCITSGDISKTKNTALLKLCARAVFSSQNVNSRMRKKRVRQHR
jgi:hypothetical protein